MKRIISAGSRGRTGFTLIELLISISVMAILGAVAYGTFFNARNANDMTTTAKRAAALLRQAQSQAASDYQAATWGVRFANGTGPSSSSFYALFSGAYITSSVQGYYVLPAKVAYLTSTLAAGTSTDITFSVLSGAASASTSIGFYSTALPSQSSTIRIASSGQISY